MRFTRQVAAMILWMSLGGGALSGPSPARAGDQEPPPAEPATPPAQGGDDTEDVRKHLEELEQKVRILERQKEVEQEIAAGKVKDAVSTSAGKDGFVIKSADGAYQLKIRGLLQADARFWKDDDNGLATDTFELRRARPILEATVSKFFDFKIQPDFGEGKTLLYDAYVDWRIAPWIKLRAGKSKGLVGLERLQSAGDLTFVERALPTNLVPNRDVGLQIQGDLGEGKISYALGVFDGAQDGANIDVDTSDSKETAARVFLEPWKGFGFGVAATRGSALGTTLAPGVPTYKTPGQQTFFSYRTTTIADGERERLSPQAYWYAGRFGAMAEYVESSQEVTFGTSRDVLKNTAWQVTVSLVLTDDRPTYKGIDPRRPYDPKGHAWGAFVVVARAGGLKVDRDAFPIFADPAVSASEARERGIGVNWYLSRNVRMMLDYIETRFTDGDAAGDREDEKVILNRLQIAF